MASVRSAVFSRHFFRLIGAVSIVVVSGCLPDNGLDPTAYARDCSEDDDCVANDIENRCETCACAAAGVAVNRSGAASMERDREELLCISSGQLCQCWEVGAVCSDGACALCIAADFRNERNAHMPTCPDHVSLTY